MSSRERAQQLRELAEHNERLAELEEEAQAAKEAYRSSPDDSAAKTRHRAASQALNDAREELSDSELMLAPATPGSQTVMPQTVRAGG
ncbi:hypothetical protein AB0395_41190 [Streptosporangium sp. NPDC051023]|uniref:hypothetical protein n=1 Tax=Streptosporangium sp. NPDC051023 TaxID=3155410 RepID=UPI00344DFDC9